MKTIILQLCLSENHSVATNSLEPYLSESQRMASWYVDWIYMMEFNQDVLGSGGIETNWNVV
jgi:hypothetical protein